MDEESLSFTDGKAHLDCIQCYRCPEPPMDISDFYEHYAKNHMAESGFPDGFHCFSCNACGMNFYTQLYAMAHSRDGCSVEKNKVSFVADLVDDTVMNCINHIQTALNICVEFCDKDTNSVLRRLWERITRSQNLEDKSGVSVAVTSNKPSDTVIEQETHDNAQQSLSADTVMEGQSFIVSETEVDVTDTYTAEASDVITDHDEQQFEDDDQHPSTSFANTGNDDDEGNEANENNFEEDDFEVDEATSDVDENEHIGSASNGMDDCEYDNISSDSGLADHAEDEYLDNEAYKAHETPAGDYSIEKMIAAQIPSSPVRSKKRRWDAREGEYSPYMKRSSYDAERETSVHSEDKPPMTMRVTRPYISSGNYDIEQGYNSQADYRQAHIIEPKQSPIFRGSRGGRGRGRYQPHPRGTHRGSIRKVDSYAEGCRSTFAHYRDKGRSTKHHGSRR